MFDTTDLQVGDEYEGSPNELSRVISSILAQGGTFTYEGRSVVVTSLPDKVKKVEEPKVEEPKVEEPKVEEPKVEEPKVEEPKASKPIGRPRKKAVSS